MTAIYNRGGVSFQYPENWELKEDLGQGPLSVYVTASSGAFWSAAIYEPHESAENLCRQALDAMRGEYDELEVDAVAEEIADESTVGYSLQFYCLDFLVRCRMLALTAMGKTLLLTWQAEDRDFDSLEPVFYAITTSLLRPVPTSPGNCSHKRKHGWSEGRYEIRVTPRP